MKSLFLLLLSLMLQAMPLSAAASNVQVPGPEALDQACRGDASFDAAFDCDCLVGALKEKHVVSGKWDQAYMELWLTPKASCFQPEGIHAHSLKTCLEKGYDLNTQLDRNGLGKERFCECVADTTVEQVSKTSSIERIMHMLADANKEMTACGA